MSAAFGGMQNAQSKLEKAAERIAGASTSSTTTPDSVDLSTETVAMLSARDQFQANAKAFQTGEQMQKTLLNILA